MFLITVELESKKRKTTLSPPPQEDDDDFVDPPQRKKAGEDYNSDSLMLFMIYFVFATVSFMIQFLVGIEILF